MLLNISHSFYLNFIRDADSRMGAASPTADDATVSAPKKRYRVSLTAFLRDSIFSQHDFRSAITGPAPTLIAPQGSNLALFRTASAPVTAVFSMLIPVSEKKFLCLNKR